MKNVIMGGVVLLGLLAFAPTGAALPCIHTDPIEEINCIKHYPLVKENLGWLGCVHVGGAHGDDPVGYGYWEEGWMWEGYYVYVDNGEDDVGVYVATRYDGLLACLL